MFASQPRILFDIINFNIFEIIQTRRLLEYGLDPFKSGLTCCAFFSDKQFYLYIIKAVHLSSTKQKTGRSPPLIFYIETSCRKIVVGDMLQHFKIVAT